MIYLQGKKDCTWMKPFPKLVSDYEQEKERQQFRKYLSFSIRIWAFQLHRDFRWWNVYDCCDVRDMFTCVRFAGVTVRFEYVYK